MTPGQPVPLLELLPQVGVLGSEPALLERRLEDVQQFLELEGLADEVGGAALDGVDGVLDSAVAGDDDADDPRITLEGGVEDLAAVDARQPEIRDEDVVGEALQLVDGLLAGRGFGHGEAFLGEPLGHDGPEGVFVVDQEDMDGFGQGGRSRLKRQYSDTNGLAASIPKSVIALAQTCSNPHEGVSDTSCEGGRPVERQTISIMKACELVGVSRRTIYNWIAAGKVEYVRTAGGSIRIFVDTLWRQPDGSARAGSNPAA